MNPLDKKVEILETWLDQHKKNSAIADTVKKLYDFSLVQQDILKQMPTGSSGELINYFATDLDYVERTLNITKTEEFDNNIAKGLLISGSTSGHAYIANFPIVDQNQYKEIGKWKSTSINKINKLINEEEQTNFIDSCYQRLFPRNREQFKQSLANFKKYEGQLLSASELAYSMRNVMNYIHGQIPNAGKKIASERGDKVKTGSWSSACPYVIKGKKNSKEAKELEKLNQFYERHHSTLSAIGKENTVAAEEKMSELFTEYIGYLYSIFSLINLDEVEKALASGED